MTFTDNRARGAHGTEQSTGRSGTGEAALRSGPRVSEGVKSSLLSIPGEPANGTEESIAGEACAIGAALLGVKGEVVSTVVSVPGGYDMAMLVAARRVGFELVVARSEAGAAWMAAALAWELGLPALLFVITSPGVYGVMQALHYACASAVPLVVVSGECSLPGSVQAGDGVGGPSVTRVTSPLTEWSADITRAAELPGALRRAVRLSAVTQRPTHLNVPAHVAGMEIRR